MMTDRDRTTRTERGPLGRWGSHPPGSALSSPRPDTERDYRSDHAVHEGRRQTGRRSAHAGSRLKLIDVSGRSRLIRQPSSRTGENPPYGMIGRIEETSASFEARSAPRSDPTDVWSGRALQENFADLAVSGLASMYPTFDWSVAPGHHGYQRACDLISGKASRRPNGSPVLARAGKTEPPSRLVLSQTWAGISQFFTRTKRLTPPWPASPRSFGHEPERSKQSWPVCWQPRSQEHCGAAASSRPRSKA